MKKTKKLKFKNLKNVLEKLPKKMAEKAFLTFIGLFVLSVVFSAFIFYGYGAGPKGQIQDTGRVGLRFKSDFYAQVLDVWGENEEAFRQTDAKQYPNLFVE